jgi:hypothetical protein
MYCMSWDEAVAFSKRLSDKESRHYRLPTEASRFFIPEFFGPCGWALTH